MPRPANRDTPNPVDVHVGRAIRLHRKLLGVTQGKLAQAIGLTFQQVQKYERGVNRVSASKLHEIAVALGCGIGDLFEGLPSSKGKADHNAANPHQAVGRFLSIDGGLDLARAYVAMPEQHRQAIVAAARAFARVRD